MFGGSSTPLFFINLFLTFAFIQSFMLSHSPRYSWKSLIVSLSKDRVLHLVLSEIWTRSCHSRTAGQRTSIWVTLHPLSYIAPYLSYAAPHRSYVALHPNWFTLHPTEARCNLKKLRYTLSKLRCGLSELRCTLPELRCTLPELRCTLSELRCTLSELPYPPSELRCTPCELRRTQNELRCTLEEEADAPGTECFGSDCTSQLLITLLSFQPLFTAHYVTTNFSFGNFRVSFCPKSFCLFYIHPEWHIRNAAGGTLRKYSDIMMVTKTLL